VSRNASRDITLCPGSPGAPGARKTGLKGAAAVRRPSLRSISVQQQRRGRPLSGAARPVPATHARSMRPASRQCVWHSTCLYEGELHINEVPCE
jgi:hypothetical protein